MDKAENNVIELEEQNIIMKIPADAIHLEIVAKVVDADGNVQQVSASHTFTDIRQMRQDFLDNVEGGDDYDVVYTLTEKGERLLEDIRRNEQWP